MKNLILILAICFMSLLSKGQSRFYNLTQTQIAQQFSAYGNKSYQIEIGEKDGKTYMFYNTPNVYTLIFRFDLEGKCEAIIKIYQLDDLYNIDFTNDLKQYIYNSSTGKVEDSTGASAEYDPQKKIIYHFRPGYKQ